MDFNNGFLITRISTTLGNNKIITVTLPIAHSTKLYACLRGSDTNPTTASLSHRSVSVKIIDVNKVAVYISSTEGCNIATIGY